MTTDSAVGGRFTLEGPIGRGGMSTVHEAFDERLRRRVALKQLRFASPVALRRFQREARLAARLNHPGVPAVYDLGEDYIAMEYVDGRPLQEVIAEAAPLPEAWSAAIGVQLAAILACAHRVGLVHRDIKPSNILMTASGAVKLIDFGVSTLVGDESLSTLTPPGVAVGSSPYRAPEAEYGEAEARSDLYSVGRLLADLGWKQDFGLTARDPDDRPSSAYELISLLRPHLGPTPPLSPFVADAALVPAVTEAYVALASLPTGPSRGTGARALPPRQARVEAERLAAANEVDEAIELLEAAIAASGDDPSVLDLRRDLTRLLITAGDTVRARAECDVLLPLLVQRLGPDHAAVRQAQAWQAQLHPRRPTRSS
jgi:serine/threonine protein kinase